MKRYKKCHSREGWLIGTQAWNEGDTQELKKWVGCCYNKHYFVNNNGIVDLYYEIKNGEEFWDALAEKLKEPGFLDSLIADFIKNVSYGRSFFNKELEKNDIMKLYDIKVKCWPAITIFDQISITPDILSDDKFINFLLEIRKNYGEFSYEFADFILKSIPKIYPEINGFEDVILIQEFETGVFPLRQELEKRKKYYSLYSHYLETDILFEELSKEHELEIVEEILEEVNEVRGDIAMRGKARGVVKLIFKTEDCNKVKIGDILVSPMTTPDHIIAMDKASAFVTDEGGITCHAAIVAREFQKPCIVGTHNATKVFKDGDLVFVDADEGVVRKIIQENPNP